MSRNKETSSQVVSECRSKCSKLKKACDGIYKLARNFGKTKEEAKALSKLKKSLFKDTADYEDKLLARSKITVGILIPIGVRMTSEEWFEHPIEERESVLTTLGLDIVDYNYMEDVLYTSTEGARYCGFCVYGQERLDDTWINQVDEDGYRQASMEAQLKAKGDDSLRAELIKLH